MIVLALDTSGLHCAVGLSLPSGRHFTVLEPMKRGQAERLMQFVEAVLDDAALTPADLGGIVVGVGPGNFTGIRIAVSAARGLALGCQIPVTSVTNFELLRGAHSLSDRAPQLVALPGPRDSVYVQHFDQGRAQGAAAQMTIEEFADPGGLNILGAQASQLAGPTSEGHDKQIEEIPLTLLSLGRAKLEAGLDIGRPVPFYVRPADAAPPKDAGPVLLP